jgi:coenzyme F420-reducing hydrogenase delta subunit
MKREPKEPRVLALLCNWCAYAGADLAGTSRLQYPPNVKVVRVMCSGKVDPLYVLYALLRENCEGVLIGGCHPGECHYVQGNLFAERRIAVLQKLLEFVGIAPQRLRLAWVSASEGKRFADVVREFVEELRSLDAG